MPIGAKVTLRQTACNEFVDRLVNIALPRVRDFRGLNPKASMAEAIISLGRKSTSLPEIEYDKVEDVLGMDIHRLHDSAHRRRGARVAGRLEFPFRS